MRARGLQSGDSLSVLRLNILNNNEEARLYRRALMYLNEEHVCDDAESRENREGDLKRDGVHSDRQEIFIYAFNFFEELHSDRKRKKRE